MKRGTFEFEKIVEFIEFVEFQVEDNALAITAIQNNLH
jgi:hypothetical protein